MGTFLPLPCKETTFGHKALTISVNFDPFCNIPHSYCSSGILASSNNAATFLWFRWFYYL